jgi:hypothetical protein
MAGLSNRLSAYSLAEEGEQSPDAPGADDAPGEDETPASEKAS